MMNKEIYRERMRIRAYTGFGKRLEDLSDKEKYIVLSDTLMEEIVPKWMQHAEKTTGGKKAFYLSAEYLMGRALSNNLINLGYLDELKEMLREMDLNYNAIEEEEDDAGLGNGGLGRLAACFLDSAATLGYPLTGYGIRYQYGIFRQKLVDGHQVEVTDDWLKYGDPWSVRRLDEKVTVRFADGDVIAVPNDTPIIGFGGKTINTLRLWNAEPVNSFDFQEFNNQHYDMAVKEKNDAETITKVLYPNDSTDEGKVLRLKQQYFFVSASLQDLLRKHGQQHKDFSNFAALHAVQLNDTHPAVAVPELIRLLMEEHGMTFRSAWKIAVKTFAYTNHTLLSEALEQWPVRLFKPLLPEVYKVIVKIDSQLKKDLTKMEVSKGDFGKYEIVHEGNIRMAWISIYGTHSTNGVAQLHTDLLTDVELRDWSRLYPERFNNKTNGITQRRWLLQSNPELSALITELLGSASWITDLDQLKGLERYAEDESVLERLRAVKQLKKNQLADYIRVKEGLEIDPQSIFDIQIKRIHEYKRQLLNAFQVLDLYYRLKEDKNLDIVPRTFIFGGKAAPGYFRAKGIIAYINAIADLVNHDVETNSKLKVVFVQNYTVSYGEKLFPAADISEQISTAGKEASGTGNMKFMLNGAPTIGTFDGANVEIVEEAGEENNFIFGLRVEDIERLGSQYDPGIPYKKTKGLKRVVESLVDGTFDDGGTGMFKELHDAILRGASWHRPDYYYILKDFASYRVAQGKVDQAFRDRAGYSRKALMNIANAGKFSSDRTISQYAKEIWEIETID